MVNGYIELVEKKAFFDNSDHKDHTKLKSVSSGPVMSKTKEDFLTCMTNYLAHKYLSSLQPEALHGA